MFNVRLIRRIEQEGVSSMSDGGCLMFDIYKYGWLEEF